MRKGTGLFRRMTVRRRPSGSGRKQNGRTFGRKSGRLMNALPVAVFTILLIICTFSNAPFENGEDGKEVLSSVRNVLGDLLSSHGGAGGGETADDGSDEDTTLKELAAISGETIRVLMTETGEIREVPLEEYTACVVASEMPADFEMEALKAQAVAARTYAAARKKDFEEDQCAHSDDGAYVCDSTHCQVYRDEAALEEVKGSQWMKESFLKILRAVSQTAGEVLYYGGELVEQPLFFSSGGDRTENSEDVFVSTIPYLRSVESGDYEAESPYNSVKTEIGLQELRSELAAGYGEAEAQSVTPDNISILGRTEGGAVSEIRFGDLTLTGRQVRELLNLKSADFEISVTGDTVTFVTSGSGHRVGLSQYGADGMAEQGSDYTEILSHYYSGINIGQIGK